MIGGERLIRLSATIEQLMTNGNEIAETAIEVSYEGSCQLDETILEASDHRSTRPWPPWAVRWHPSWSGWPTFPSASGLPRAPPS